MHGGDQVAKFLHAQGVQQLFTLCGGHISPILSGARALGIRIVDVRDEATAVFAADAAARLTGVPGVAAVTAGPGLTNTVTAIKNAELAQSPVVILGGLDSIPGAVVGGLFIGLLQAYVAGYTPSHLALSTIIPFIVLIIVLMIKPYGLFGEERIERV